MAESDKVTKAVIEATGASYEKATKLCTVAHEIVDECITDDISVVAPPLVIGRLGCPVLEVSELSIEEISHRIIQLVERRQAGAG